MFTVRQADYASRYPRQAAGAHCHSTDLVTATLDKSATLVLGEDVAAKLLTDGTGGGPRITLGREAHKRFGERVSRNDCVVRRV